VQIGGEEFVLTYTLNNTKPIDLLDLIASLLALGSRRDRRGKREGSTSAR